MTLTPIKANMTELDLGNRTRVLFSYRTPVAAFVDGVYRCTSKKWSRTTSRHINAWHDHYTYVDSQEFFDNLIAGVK
jgi:hypothetical protein